MLRPATPLTILLFISFVLLLISTISTPIVKGIPLARYQGVNFGVFGWCKDSGECSNVQIGWNTDEALPPSEDDRFNLPASARHSLSNLLIVHPVAALCNLIVLGLAVAAHLHSPSHSARYLLGLLILLLPTLLITLLAFLVDILLFVPHLQWGGWIVLASTILITASGVVTCAMRRTLVSRKARKKRIAENAEMSGANFFSRQANESTIVPHSSIESKAPMMNGASGANNLPAFSTYPSVRSGETTMIGSSTMGPMSATSPVEEGRYYGGQRSRSTSRPRQEDFSAPLGAVRSYEERPPMPVNNRGSYGQSRGGFPPRGAMSARGGPSSRGLPSSPYRGRGGYPPRGRGGYHPGPTQPPVPPGVIIPAGMNRRPPPGYGPQSPDEMGPRYGPPPPGPDGSYVGRSGSAFEPPSPSVYDADVNTGYGGPAYGARAQSPGPVRQSPYGSRAQSPAQRRQSPYGSRAQSPAGGRPDQGMPPAMPPIPDQYGAPQRSVAGMDPDVLGMVEMQKSQQQMPPQRVPSGEYVPPRSAWSNGPHAGPHSPVRRSRATSGGSDYMEDVDPKFAEHPPPVPSAQLPAAYRQHSNEPHQSIPSLLLPGHNHHDPSPESSSSQVAIPVHMQVTSSDIPHTSSYENLHPGARSPVESEASHFTSVSQRPANPNWQPGHGGEFNNFGPPAPRHQQQRRQDVLFAGNPDFELPGMGPPRVRAGPNIYGRGRGGYGGMGPGPRGGPMRPPPPSVLENMGADGRYPNPVPPQQGGGGVMREI